MADPTSMKHQISSLNLITNQVPGYRTGGKHCYYSTAKTARLASSLLTPLGNSIWYKVMLHIFLRIFSVFSLKLPQLSKTTLTDLITLNFKQKIGRNKTRIHLVVFFVFLFFVFFLIMHSNLWQ